MGMVERSDVKPELIADLCKNVSTFAVMTAKPPTYANKVVEVDWWYTCRSAQLNQAEGSHFTSLITVVRDLF